MDENMRRMLRDVASARAMLRPENLQREVSQALSAREEAMRALGAYRHFKTTQPLPSAATHFEDLAKTRQQALDTALGGLKDVQRTAIQNALTGIQKSAVAGSQEMPFNALGRVLNDAEAIRRITEPLRQNWLQSALRDARSVLQAPEVQRMFVDMEAVRELLEQAEAMETDAGDIQADLPENLDPETFLSLDIHTLIFIIEYFNSVLTVLVISLTVGTFGVEQSQMITNIEDACIIARGVTELSLQALKQKAGSQNTD
jgi:hypothetical protein